MQPLSDVKLDVAPNTISGLFPAIVKISAGKRVLNVGATGGVEQYLPDHRNSWLHELLLKNAASVLAIDIDRDSIAYAERHGVDVQYADAMTFKSDDPFDVIVLSDVIEHMDSVVPTIANLVSLLTQGGVLVITTPNPTHFGTVLRCWLGRHASIYSDHTAAFMPEHIQVIANRIGARVTKVSFFTHLDQRTTGMVFKSWISRLAGWLMPRSHGSMLVCVQRKV